LLTLYQHYNRQYFDGRLPAIRIRVRPPEKNRLSVDAEYEVASGTIFFSSGATDEDLVRTVLLHEMVHVAVPEDGHGTGFRTELRRLAEMGVEDAEYEVWRMVGDEAWDDGWIGDESGRWQRLREGGDY
jgi:hypothetical protein